MNQMTLTEKDCELLLEAIDAWEKAPMADGAVGGIMQMMLSKIGPPVPGEDAGSRHMERALDKGRRDSDGRKRVAIVLRAKVEILRQELQAVALRPGSEVQS